MKLDIFNHIFPRAYYDRMLKVAPNGKDMHKRVREIPCIVDLDERFRIMDSFGDYAQVICLGSPPIEVFGPPPRLDRDGATRQRRHGRAGAQASGALPGVHRLAADERSRGPACARPSARSASSAPSACRCSPTCSASRSRRPETLPLFDLMAKLDRPIWLHPARGADFPDYKREKKSHYEIWWTFGWPYETSVAMAHIVFAGLFDKHPGPEDHHAPHGRHDPLLRGPRRPGLGPARRAAPRTRTTRAAEES